MTLLVTLSLILPAAALAHGAWTVKDPSGVKIGSVRVESWHRSDVYNRHGKPVGTIVWKSTKHEYIVSSGGHKAEEFKMGSGWEFTATDAYAMGAANKENGRWVIYSDAGTGPAMGSVSGRCPGWAADGALFAIYPI